MAAGRNIGAEAEDVANQYLSQQTGLDFKPFQNNSGNGADGIPIGCSDKCEFTEKLRKEII